MVFKPTDTKRLAAFTLIEMLVTVPLCVLLLGGMVSLYCFTIGSFASLTTYSSLDQKTRHAGDIISRDVRSARSVDDTTTSKKLVLNSTASGPTTYLYNTNLGTLVRSNSTGVQQLLTNVVSLSFALYQRPTNSALAYESLPTANPGSAKLVGFAWTCSKRIVASRSDSQEIQAGIVELRNQ